MTGQNLQPFQVRVLAELTELNRKASNLCAFLDTDPFKELPSEDRTLLMQQYSLMVQYAHVLLSRVLRFPAAALAQVKEIAAKELNESFTLTPGEIEFEQSLNNLVKARDGRALSVVLYRGPHTADGLRLAAREFGRDVVNPHTTFLCFDEQSEHIELVATKEAEAAAWTNLALLAQATAAAIRAGR